MSILKTILHPKNRNNIDIFPKTSKDQIIDLVLYEHSITIQGTNISGGVTTSFAGSMSLLNNNNGDLTNTLNALAEYISNRNIVPVSGTFTHSFDVNEPNRSIIGMVSNGDKFTIVVKSISGVNALEYYDFSFTDIFAYSESVNRLI